ncbi:PREDICTED: interferon alpha-7-like [Gekko japonicus]|uniref:Interferon alpha-7-like n=1 Tax=Gekko japonicus TaxID=146911 RepID=A0ABM1JRF5_GEKJA|nr:PREDICTED: interferon alpha-7-like [Gekko japonicus]
MATLSLQGLCLLLLLTLEILALDCNKTAENQLRVNNPEVRKRMEAIGGQQLPQECLYKRPTFSFPEEKILRASKEGKSVAVKMILEKILKIFEHNFTQAGWDPRTVALLQNALYQQSNQWKNCSTTETGEVATLKERDLNLNLLRYFRQIQTFLEGQQYCLCAWSVVRLEIWKLFFVSLDKLLNRF